VVEKKEPGYLGHWEDAFDNRELALIRNCCAYADGEPVGLPGHKLMLIVARMASLLTEEEAGGYKMKTEGAGHA
jgi:hypothetical protein